MMSLFRKRFVLLMILWFVVLGFVPANLGGAEKLTIAYIGDEIGRLEPCG